MNGPGPGSVHPSDRKGRRPHLVSPAHFVVAIRDSGYKTTSLAVAELIDNAVQAGARQISVVVQNGDDQQYPIEVMVIDDGVGMDASTLSAALTFGGSSRFDDRSSLGRYGMGLPNGSLSRARRIEIYTWQGDTVLTARLDVDEVVAHGWRTLPPVGATDRPPFAPSTPSGTVVRLLRCDRVENKRPSVIIRKLESELGRIYRRFLSRGLRLYVNDRPIRPFDPLRLDPDEGQARSRQFGNTLAYELPWQGSTGKIEVRFSELPIDQWHALPSAEKRELGVTNGPCVSILRADREIDRGWFFMGAKRRENYDDWWRCEVSFSPELDELFGITHAKQTVSPRDELLQVLTPDLEPIARALNAKVRQRFELLKVTTPISAAERQASRAESALPPLPKRRDPVPEALVELLEDRTQTDGTKLPYRLIITELPTSGAFEIVVRDQQLVLFLNTRHPLYRDLYGPLALSDSDRDHDVATRVALAVLAAGRAEAATARRADRNQVQRFRQAWADVLATFFNA